MPTFAHSVVFAASASDETLAMTDTAANARTRDLRFGHLIIIEFSMHTASSGHMPMRWDPAPYDATLAHVNPVRQNLIRMLDMIRSRSSSTTAWLLCAFFILLSIRYRSDVDRKGNRVVVATGSAYDLYLTRELKAATLIRVSTSQAVVDSMRVSRRLAATERNE